MREKFLKTGLFALFLGIFAAAMSCGDDDDSTDDDNADDDGGDDDSNTADDDNGDDDNAGGDDSADDSGDDAADDVSDDAGDDADDDAFGGIVEDPWQSECLAAKSDEPDFTYAESVVIDYIDGALQVQHLNTCRNCDFQFEGNFSVEGQTISVMELDVEPMVALCDCPYNLSYGISGIVAAAYTFSLSIADDKEGMDPTPRLVFEDALDLTQQNHFEFDLGEHDCI